MHKIVFHGFSVFFNEMTDFKIEFSDAGSRKVLGIIAFGYHLQVLLPQPRLASYY